LDEGRDEGRKEIEKDENRDWAALWQASPTDAMRAPSGKISVFSRRPSATNVTDQRGRVVSRNIKRLRRPSLFLNGRA